MARLTDKDRDRMRATKQAAEEPSASTVTSADSVKQEQEEPQGFMRTLRGWTDALVFAFLLAMFIRTYVFELFMIPTGSMTPTLIGDDRREVNEYDWDNDGDMDIVLLQNPYTGPLQVHLRNEDGNFGEMLYIRGVPLNVRKEFSNPENKGKGRRDMIMVNKFAYWFSPPDRGDIAVFKVPDRPERNYPFLPSKPVYIKRVMGLPGEEIIVQPLKTYEKHTIKDPDRISPGRFGGIEMVVKSQPILVNEEPLEGPLFERLHHFPKVAVDQHSGFIPSPYTQGQKFELTDEEVLMLGDNQASSQDSRYWGPVPTSHLRGRAILRYSPFRRFGFLDQNSGE